MEAATPNNVDRMAVTFETFLEHVGVGVAFAGAALVGGYVAGQLASAVPVAAAAFMLGFHGNYSLSQILQKIEAYAEDKAAPAQTTSVLATAAVPAAAAPVASSASVPIVTEIPANYGAQVGAAVVVTASNAAYQTLGNGIKVYDAWIGSVVRKTNLGWYVVNTVKGVAYTRDCPLNSDTYFEQAPASA